jgi:hypothetical protein
LHQNYPNPFNPKTVINYELRITGYVKLTVFDIRGRHIIDLVEQKQSMGKYETVFNGTELSSGVYLYSLQVSDEKNNVFSETRKMILIK